MLSSSLGDLEQHSQGDVELTALDGAVEATVEAGGLGEAVLVCIQLTDRHGLVVEDCADLDAAAEGLHVALQRREADVVAALELRDVRL